MTRMHAREEWPASTSARRTSAIALCAVLILTMGALGCRPGATAMPTGLERPTRSSGQQSSGKSAATERHFVLRRALYHVAALSHRIGARPEGGAGERRAADYIAGRLAAYGYKPQTQRVRLPRGKVSRNVVATKEGRTADVMVLGAHYDSVRGSPGANDNAASVSTVIEIARVLQYYETAPTLKFVFFGAEEELDEDPDTGLYGSAAFVETLSPQEKARMAGAILPDMVTHGTDFRVRSMSGRSRLLWTALLSYAKSHRVRLRFLKASRDGDADYESFESAGIPAVWLEREDDPNWHTRFDNYRNVEPSRVSTTGALLEGFLVSLTAEQTARLRTANRNR